MARIIRSRSREPGEVEPGAVAAEVEIEDDEVGRTPVGERERVPRAGGLTDDDEIGVGGEQLAQAEADDRLAVDDQQAGGPPGLCTHRTLVEQGHGNLLAASAASS
jgi:hypothetical protein